MGFFARPDDLTRINFEDGLLAGEWMMVRTRLSHAEEQRLYAGMFVGVRPDEQSQRLEVDATGFDVNRIVVWVQRWSLTGDKDRGARPRRDEVEALLPEVAAEILGAIERHEAAAKEDRIRLDPKRESSEGSEEE